MRLLIDVDGVLRDVMNKVLEIYKREVNPTSTVKINDITDFWYMERQFHEIPDISDYFFRQHAEEVFGDSLPYETTMSSTLERLARRHELFIVTHQYEGNEQYTIDWLDRYDVPRDEIVFAEDKTVVTGDIGIDDGIHNLVDYRDNNVLPVAMARPWNRDWHGFKVWSMTDFENFVNNYY